MRNPFKKIPEPINFGCFTHGISCQTKFVWYMYMFYDKHQSCQVW